MYTRAKRRRPIEKGESLSALLLAFSAVENLIPSHSQGKCPWAMQLWSQTHTAGLALAWKVSSLFKSDWPAPYCPGQGCKLVHEPIKILSYCQSSNMLLAFFSREALPSGYFNCAVHLAGQQQDNGKRMRPGCPWEWISCNWLSASSSFGILFRLPFRDISQYAGARYAATFSLAACIPVFSPHLGLLASFNWSSLVSSSLSAGVWVIS